MFFFLYLISVKSWLVAVQVQLRERLLRKCNQSYLWRCGLLSIFQSSLNYIRKTKQTIFYGNNRNICHVDANCGANKLLKIKNNNK